MDSKTTDNELMFRVKGGDRQAFENLYERYSRTILNFFFRLEWDSGRAEEGVQEVFYRLWKYRKQYEPRGKFTTYLFQIAKNFWLNEMKKKRPQTDASALATRQAGSPRPDRQLERKELRDIVRVAISGLPENERLPFVMARYHGLRHKEIGEVLGVSSRAVESRISSALKKLESRLAHYDLLPDGTSF
ncbi:MAG: RNA polymerase sigma factor [Planctomycetota bacterium]|jgi:RNA polymerase sigma-70 factor (ECF subfamily)